MSVTVRFAPSPTGRLHVGNARVALINFLFARQAGGRFILRIDDTDTERSRKEHEDAIEIDLTWLGLTWDHKANQSARFAAYEAAAERLKAEGRLYACYETAEELDYKRKRQMARGAPPVYDRAALALSVIRATREFNFSRGVVDSELSWILARNTRVRHVIEMVGGVPYKTYRVFEKPL